MYKSPLTLNIINHVLVSQHKTKKLILEMQIGMFFNPTPVGLLSYQLLTQFFA